MKLKVFIMIFAVTFFFASDSLWAQETAVNPDPGEEVAEFKADAENAGRVVQKKAVNPDSEEDVAELIADAEDGDRGAQYDLSMVYAFKQDAANALKWLTKSAENGYGRAQYTLGSLYYNGSSKVKRNYEKAIQWLEASKKTNYNGENVDALIASAKQKIVDEKKAIEAKKKAKIASAQAAKKKAAEEAEIKAKEAQEAAEKAAAEAAMKVKEAQEAAERAALEAAEKAAQEAKQAAEDSKSIFHKIKDKVKEKVSNFLNFFRHKQDPVWDIYDQN